MENSNICKTSKKERKKKAAKIADTLHRCFGNKRFTGIGKGKPLICDICGKRVYKIKIKIINNKLVNICENC